MKQGPCISNGTTIFFSLATSWSSHFIPSPWFQLVLAEGTPKVGEWSSSEQTTSCLALKFTISPRAIHNTIHTSRQVRGTHG